MDGAFGVGDDHIRLLVTAPGGGGQRDDGGNRAAQHHCVLTRMKSMLGGTAWPVDVPATVAATAAFTRKRTYAAPPPTSDNVTLVPSSRASVASGSCLVERPVNTLR